MRAPLSGSTGSREGTGDGSRDGSTRERDGDSDEAPTLSGRVTGLRSARQRPKRLTPDEVRCHAAALLGPMCKRASLGCAMPGNAPSA